MYGLKAYGFLGFLVLRCMVNGVLIYGFGCLLACLLAGWLAGLLACLLAFLLACLLACLLAHD